jgi:cytochrome P450
MTDPAEPLFEPRGGEAWRDPFSMYRALRDRDPVHHCADGDYWVLSRFADVHDAAVDYETFSSAEGLTFNYGEKEQLGIEAPLVMMDPPDHTALRALISKGFTPRRVSEIEPEVRGFVVERIDDLIERGEGDIVAQLLKPLPSLVVADYLGVPRAMASRGLSEVTSQSLPPTIRPPVFLTLAMG